MITPRRILRSAMLLLAIPVLFAVPAHAQPVQVSCAVDADNARTPISPYIFGSNGQTGLWNAGITARRLGGNRLTGYNWENNASNAGADWQHQSDNYLTWGLPPSRENEPGIVMTAFHDTSLAEQAYSLVTLQMAGYVARDKNGPVGQEDVAPSYRWVPVNLEHNEPPVDTPDTSDNRVSMQQLLQFLVARYGTAASGRGINGYALDNEPALWPSTHPRLHPNAVPIEELSQGSRVLSQTIKRIDSTAEIFGPVSFGYSELLTFQNAPDWPYFSSYGRFVNCYLAHMKMFSEGFGRRLLDVLDIHWYPEAQGLNNNGTWERILSGPGTLDSGVVAARLQAPRSLWDSTWREHSWIGDWFHPIRLIPDMRAAIDQWYPGTKLAITEFDYGAHNHISGGLAMADALGIFAREGVYMANYWGDVGSYIRAAYMLYRNPDGAHGEYGDLAAPATSGDQGALSIHASRDSRDTTALHIILINKRQDSPVDADVALTSGTAWRRGDLWVLDGNSADIRRGASVGITDNMLRLTLAPLSAVHCVVRSDTATTSVATTGARVDLRLDVFPNPSTTGWTARCALADGESGTLTLRDMLGRVVWRRDHIRGAWSEFIPAATATSQGLLFLEFMNGRDRTIAKLVR